MKIKVLLSALTLLFASSVLSAQTTSKVAKRQVKQQKRIQQGVRSGELTKKETVKLQAQQRRVHKHKQAVKADGVITKKERVSLHAHQNRASRTIEHKKNN